MRAMSPAPVPLIFHEQKPYGGSDAPTLRSILERNGVELTGMPTQYMGKPKYLGISPSLEAGYFIGASWLIEGELPAVVLPKIEGIDIAAMLACALSVSTPREVDYFSRCYGISFDEPPIQTEEGESRLTPILIIHFLTLLENLLRHGLRRDYVTVTENLTGKVKGHLLLGEQFRRNILPRREDRNVCRYGRYDVDIPVNRLLKRALLFSEGMLGACMKSHPMYGQLRRRMNHLKGAFEGVSDDISIPRVKALASNKLFRHYSPAVRTACDILRRYDYSLSEAGGRRHSTPPFWIDMSRLFEMYVLYVLRRSNPKDIEFQFEGTGQVPDFVHKRENMVLDAKYKPMYGGPFRREMIDDIRELSGNARDLRVRDILPNGEEEPHCVIIYPSAGGLTTLDSPLGEIARMNPIREFHRFYKIALRLPVLGERK